MKKSKLTIGQEVMYCGIKKNDKGSIKNPTGGYWNEGTIKELKDSSVILNVRVGLRNIQVIETEVAYEDIYVDIFDMSDAIKYDCMARQKALKAQLMGKSAEETIENIIDYIADETFTETFYISIFRQILQKDADIEKMRQDYRYEPFIGDTYLHTLLIICTKLMKDCICKIDLTLEFVVGQIFKELLANGKIEESQAIMFIKRGKKLGRELDTSFLTYFYTFQQYYLK